VRSVISPYLFPLAPDGAPIGVLTPAPTPGVFASVDGLDFTQDRVTVVHGRDARLDQPNEFVATVDAARVLWAHVGQVIPMGAYTDAQTSLPGFGTAKVARHLRIDARLVGIVVVNTQLLEDDVDRFPSTSGFMFFTPALARQLPGTRARTSTGYSSAREPGASPASSNGPTRSFPPGHGGPRCRRRSWPRSSAP